MRTLGRVSRLVNRKVYADSLSLGVCNGRRNCSLAEFCPHNFGEEPVKHFDLPHHDQRWIVDISPRRRHDARHSPIFISAPRRDGTLLTNLPVHGLLEPTIPHQFLFEFLIPCARSQMSYPSWD